ncbi:MAG: protein translocase subunit SecF [Myxococcota bacterium]
MLHIIKPGTKFDFLGRAPLFVKVSAGVFAAAVLILLVNGLNLGLDFAGGHEILLRFDKPVEATEVRSQLNNLFPNVDTAVQSFEVPTEADKTFYMARIERSEAFGKTELADLENAFQGKYGEAFKKLNYNPEAGDVVRVQFVAGATTGVDLSKAALAKVVEGTNHPVRVVRQIGREEQLQYEVQLSGVDASLVKALKPVDPSVTAVRVEFVGPTIGRQLRDDGILAVVYAMICILIYVAIRFDLYYSPGAILCLVHDAVITTALLSLLGQEFTLATIAGLLTLVGYSINDTIVVFDRIRETVGNSQGAGMSDILNQAVNETLGRTLMTSITTLIACICLMFFGRGTVLFSFGLIMTVGILIGTYSSIYVASPTFKFLRERFAPKEIQSDKRARQAKQTVVV